SPRVMRFLRIHARCVALAAVAVMALGLGERARAQAPGSDSPGFTAAGSGTSLLGLSPGAGGGALGGNTPGAGQLLVGRPGAPTSKGLTTAALRPEPLGPTTHQQPITAPEAQPISPSTAPLYGTLEIPQAGADDDGPADGVTLEAAIDATLQRSLDLRAKFFE